MCFRKARFFCDKLHHASKTPSQRMLSLRFVLLENISQELCLLQKHVHRMSIFIQGTVSEAYG